MIRTEFKQSDYEIAILSKWNFMNDDSKTEVCTELNSKGGLPYLENLHDTIIKNCAEFISYVDNIRESTDFELLKERINAKYSSAAFSVDKVQPYEMDLLLRNEKLIREKAQMVARQKHRITKLRRKFRQDTKNAIRTQVQETNFLRKELENAYKVKAADLKMFFKAYCVRFLRLVIKECTQLNDDDFDTYSTVDSNEDFEPVCSGIVAPFYKSDFLVSDEMRYIHDAYKVEIENLLKNLKYHCKKTTNEELYQMNVDKQCKQNCDNEDGTMNPICVLLPFANEPDNYPQTKNKNSFDVKVKDEPPEPGIYVKEEKPLDIIDVKNEIHNPLESFEDNFSPTKLIEGDDDVTFVGHTYMEQEEEKDDFDFPDIDFFHSSYWTPERLKDVRLVHKLIKLCAQRTNNKFKKMFNEDAWMEYKNFCRINKYKCWEVKCLVQNIRFPTKKELDIHIKLYHPHGKTIYACYCCHYPFPSNESRREHLKNTGVLKNWVRARSSKAGRRNYRKCLEKRKQSPQFFT